MPRLSQNMLKLLGALFMTIDHFGMLFFPRIVLFRMIGRLAFPIFAYFIFIGCLYTKHFGKYFLRVLSVGMLCLLVYGFVYNDWFGNIMLTFSLSMLWIRALELCLFSHTDTSSFLRVGKMLMGVGISCLIWGVTVLFPVDYGLAGVATPVLAYLAYRIAPVQKKRFACLGLALGLLLVSLSPALACQYLCLLAIPLLLLENGERGFPLPRYFFYLFYPVHLGILGLLSMYL